jgi:hypothetical protein
MRQKSLAIVVGAMLLALTIQSDAEEAKPNSAFVQKWLSEEREQRATTFIGYVTEGKKTTIYFSNQKVGELGFTICVQLDQGGWFCDPQKATSGRVIRP